MGHANLASVLASMTFGYTIGFGYLTAWDAYKLIKKAKNPFRNVFTWMVCGVIFACVAMSVGAWLVIHDYIHVSVASLFLTLLLWVVQVHFILQIIINRIAIISPTQEFVNRVRWGVAIFITIINVTVIVAFIPAVMGVSPAFTIGGEAYVKVAKVIILLTDCCLNFYFILTVKENLVRNGLKKYEKLADFNSAIIVVSLFMDVFLFATTFLPGRILFVPFLPVTYITKLKIELSMTKLIIKIAKEDSNDNLMPASLQSQQSSQSSNATAVSHSLPNSGHIYSGSGEIEIIRGMDLTRNMEGVSSFGLGIGKDDLYIRTQHVEQLGQGKDKLYIRTSPIAERRSESTVEERDQVTPRWREGEFYGAV